jgi:hypothetical protein
MIIISFFLATLKYMLYALLVHLFDLLALLSLCNDKISKLLFIVF